MITNTDPVHNAQSNQLDQHPDAKTPLPGLHDDRYTIENLTANLASALRTIEALNARIETLETLNTRVEALEAAAQDTAKYQTVIIDQAVAKRTEALKRSIDEKLYETQDQWKINFDTLRDRVNDTPTGNVMPKGKASLKEIPPVTDINDLYVQEFDNTDKIKALRAKNMKTSMPFFQATVRVNGKDEWKIPLHLPAGYKGRGKIKENLGAAYDTLDFDPNQYNQIGVLQQGTVIVCLDRQHRLRVRIHGEWFDFPLPDLKQSHHAEGSPIRRWSLKTKS